MSRDMFLSITVDAPLDKNFCQELLTQGIHYGLTYFKSERESYPPTASDIVSTNTALQNLLTGIAYLKSSDYHPIRFNIQKIPQVEVGIEGTLFTLLLGIEDSCSYITIDPSADMWYINNESRNGRGYIDWERYVRLGLALCKDFPIVKIRTYDSYYDE
jgi:hypothetical protein